MTNYEKAILEAVSHVPIDAKTAADRFLYIARAVERLVVSELGLGTTIQDGRDGVGEWIEASRRSRERIEQLDRIKGIAECDVCKKLPDLKHHTRCQNCMGVFVAEAIQVALHDERRRIAEKVRAVAISADLGWLVRMADEIERGD